MASSRKKTKRRKPAVITEYDERDTSTMIDPRRPLRFDDLGLELPKPPPTQIVTMVSRGTGLRARHKAGFHPA